MLTTARVVVRSSWISLLLLGGILAGALVGRALPAAGESLGECVDATLLALVALLFFGVRFDAVLHAWKNLRFLGLVVAANFMLVLAIGYAIAAALLPAQPHAMVGLAIYFMAPCTDWFLGFTRLARGNVPLGTALIPINMAAQLLLYPFYIELFTHGRAAIQAGLISGTLLHWFVAPLAGAAIAHHVLRRLLGATRFARLLHRADQATPWVLALLVMEIFAAHIAVILEHRAVFAWVMLGVFLFFAATCLLGEAIGRLARLAYPEHALLTMSIAARNAPLMLAVTMAALPGQPLTYAALVIGMLAEFPHLTVLQRLLPGRAGPQPGSRISASASPPTAAPAQRAHPSASRIP